MKLQLKLPFQFVPVEYFLVLPKVGSEKSDATQHCVFLGCISCAVKVN